MTIGVAVTGGAQPGTRLEVLGLHPLERVMVIFSIFKARDDLRRAPLAWPRPLDLSSTP